MKFYRKIKNTARCVLAAAPLLAPKCEAQLVAQAQTSLTQSASLVSPRSYLVFSNQLNTNGQYFGTGTITNTNAIIAQFGTNNLSWLTNQNVYCLAPTMIPAIGSHEIALTAIIQNTNNFAHSSNMVVTVYPAYDTTGGSSASVSPRYGQLFSSTPLLTWTITYTTNSVQSTNLTVPQWCPTTSLGYTFSNAASANSGSTTSNQWFTLVQTDAP